MRNAVSVLALALVGCSGEAPSMADFEKNLPRRVMDPPLDLPDWSESEYVRWASVKVQDERAIIIDIPGGTVDKMLDDEDVSDTLNAEFRAIFLHPRARPWLTQHVGWPSVTLVDEQGCLRATGSPSSADDLLTLLEDGVRAREEGTQKSLPMPLPSIPDVPDGGGTWTLDEPDKAAVFVQPERGAPAVIFDGRPWVYGNRADAKALEDRPAARQFLDGLDEGVPFLVSEGPILNCPLPIPQPPKPVPADEDEEGEGSDQDDPATGEASEGAGG